MQVGIGEDNKKGDKLEKKYNDPPTKTPKGDPLFGC